MSAHLDTASISFFRTFGYGVHRRFFDPRPLTVEIERAMRSGLVSGEAKFEAARFRYLPMMTSETAVSLALLDRIESLAASLLGGSVLPTRAKGVRYSGDTAWHTDSTSPLDSVGFLAYLEPLNGEDGALRVIPGSHHVEFRNALHTLEVNGAHDEGMPAHAIVSEPGDLIVLDEHLYHASFGGRSRLQWRVDFVRAPATAADRELTHAYFSGIFPPDWDGGYDVDRYPSYGVDWRNSRRPAVAQLADLGVYELAARQEAFTRTMRQR